MVDLYNATTVAHYERAVERRRLADGFAKVPRALLQSKALTGHAKLIYALLQAHDGPQGCYPSLALLAEESGWSKPTVLKAIGELEAVGAVRRQRRRFLNAYVLTDSTSFTPSETDSTSLTNGVNHVASVGASNGRRSKPGLPTDSTSFTDGVNHVDQNKSHLTSITEQEEPETEVRRARAPKATPPCEPPPNVVVPPALEAFDAVLQDAPGYAPNQRLFEQLVETYRSLDLEEEAIKMADWLREPRQRRAKKSCSNGFILGWLRRTLNDGPRAVNGHARPAPYRNGKGPIGRQTPWIDDPDEKAAMRALGVVNVED